MFRIEKEIGIVEVLSAFRIRSGVIGISRRDGIKPGFEEREGGGSNSSVASKLIDTIELIDVAIVEGRSLLASSNETFLVFFFSINKNKGAVSSEDC